MIKDHQMMLDTLGEFSERFEIDIFTYVLMSNHHHLLVRTKLADLKKAMHWLRTTYTQRFNFNHHRSGHLFQGRYNSFIVENDVYLLRLSYYIHRNPLRAKMVKRLADYRWSSYRYYAYGKKPPEWLSTDLILSQQQRPMRIIIEATASRYKNMPRRSRHYGKIFDTVWFMGLNRFVDRIRRKDLPENHPADMPQQNQLSISIDAKSYLSEAGKLLELDPNKMISGRRFKGVEKDKGDLLIYSLWRSGKYANREIVKICAVSYSSVSHAVKSIKSKLTKNFSLRDKFNIINSQFKL